MGHKIRQNNRGIMIVLLLLAMTLIISYGNSRIFNAYSYDNQFSRDTEEYSAFIESQKDNKILVNPDGTIRYLYENFDEYGAKYSKEIEQFESPDDLTITGPATSNALSEECYNGKHSLSLSVNPKGHPGKPVSIRKDLPAAIDLSRWNESGYLTAWMKIEERKGISGIILRIGDETGAYRQYAELANLLMDIPNYMSKDDPYPDLAYPIRDSISDEWTDFWLNKGWNYLPWRMDEQHYEDYGNVDLDSITWIEIIINTDSDIRAQEILLDNLRVQDGLQKDVNPLGGFWHPPHGRPQYGVYDIDKVAGDDYALKLLNVRQAQYLSNGDHGRMISINDAPINFSIRTRFMLTDLGKKNDRYNTWFRMAYDFEPDWDPGHDQFIAYLSMEWNKFGLVTVYPIERYVLQDSEPKGDLAPSARTGFTPEENVMYEMHLTVHGQAAKASIYEVDDRNRYLLKRTVEYEFSRPRYGPEKRYPIVLEVTGNVKARIYEIEMAGF